MGKKTENLTFYALFLTGIIIFVYYVYILFEAKCGRFGYTLCAALGEDFFHLYQAGYNFLHGYYVYGPEASEHLVTPFFMANRYFPAMFIFFGWPFLYFSDPMAAYHSYLYLAIAAHYFGLWFIWLIYKRFKSSKITLGFAFLAWLSFFPLNSEWRMGQFNDISGVFLLGSIAALVYNREIFSAFSWVTALAWKPLPLFGLLYFIKTRGKYTLILFSVIFVLITGLYVGTFQMNDHMALTNFLDKMISSKNDVGFQIHYIDNFGVFSLIGELFFDKSPILYSYICKAFTVLIFSLLLFITFISNINELRSKLYLLLFTTSTILIYHKLVWESVLCFWLPIIVVSLIIAKNKQEKILIGICTLFLATPSLFYYQQIYETDAWRFLLIAEKAVPQLILYLYLATKCISLSRKERKKKQVDNPQILADIIH